MATTFENAGTRVKYEIRADIAPRERLIVALDVDTGDEAIELVELLGENVSFYKVGLQLFMEGGLSIVKQLVAQGKKVFLDLKIDDTPRTVEHAVRQAAIEGVKFFTLQGNADTAQAARAGRGDQPSPQLLQVTLLSSWDRTDLIDHLHVPPALQKTLVFDDFVLHRTARILDSGCDGVIASGSSVTGLRANYPDVLIVTPGIRANDASKDDHKRSLTPSEAIFAGADYLVVGRPIRNADDPKATAAKIQEEIAQAVTNKAV